MCHICARGTRALMRPGSTAAFPVFLGNRLFALFCFYFVSGKRTAGLHNQSQFDRFRSSLRAHSFVFVRVGRRPAYNFTTSPRDLSPGPPTVPGATPAPRPAERSPRLIIASVHRRRRKTQQHRRRRSYSRCYLYVCI